MLSRRKPALAGSAQAIKINSQLYSRNRVRGLTNILKDTEMIPCTSPAPRVPSSTPWARAAQPVAEDGRTDGTESPVPWISYKHHLPGDVAIPGRFSSGSSRIGDRSVIAMLARQVVIASGRRSKMVRRNGGGDHQQLAAARDVHLADLGQDLRNPRQHVVNTFLDGGVHGLIDIEGIDDFGGAR